MYSGRTKIIAETLEMKTVVTAGGVGGSHSNRLKNHDEAVPAVDPVAKMPDSNPT